MKKIIASFLMLSSLYSHAQDVDRTKAPAPAVPPVINIPDPAAFTLPNGLKVFVVRNTKLPQVSATLTIDIDPVSEGDKAGMQSMAGTLMRYGTTKMKKVRLDEEIDFLGGSINTDPTSVSASSLTNNFSKLFALMADIALRPTFPAAELEKIRTQTLSGLEANKEDPKAISDNISKVLLYGKKHPYGEIETEATVKKVTVADVKKYYSTYWKPNIAYLVFVGDITTEQAKKLAIQYFGVWAKGVVPKQTYATVTPLAKTYIAIVDRPSSVQSVIDISTPVQLKPGAPDAIPASVMNAVLGGGFSSRLSQNLREKHGFTYGSYSSLSTDRLVGNFSAEASVRNEKTDSSIAEFLYELKRIRTEQAADTEVTSLKNYMSGGFARSLEYPATIAAFALNIARYNLPKDYYRNYLSKLSSVTPGAVQEMAKKYIDDGMLITIVGNAREIAPGLEKYGQVKYFDIYGKEIAAPAASKKVDPNLKGEDILKKAVEAYGGENVISAIKDIELDGKMEMMGQSIDYVQKNVFPSGYTRSVNMGGMTFMKQMKKDTVYSMIMQGADAPVDAASKEDLDASAAFYKERYMLKQPGYVFTIKAIEQLNGKDSYVVDIKSPAGNATTIYYDVATGLKVQEITEKESPMGKMNVTIKYEAYKLVNGLQIPIKMTVDLEQFKQEINIEDIKINHGLKLTDL